MLPTPWDSAVDSLTVAQRLELIDRLWDSIPDSESPPLPEWHRLELERRLADADANPEAAMISLDKAHHRLFGAT